MTRPLDAKIRRPAALPRSGDPPFKQVGQVGRDSKKGFDEQDGQEGQAGQDSEGEATPIKKVVEFLTDYVVLPENVATVIAAWVAAAWLSDSWDKFPHLAITSPEKRCGKTTLLEILSTIVPHPLSTSNISPAALYRVIQGQLDEGHRPTIMLDEAQSLSRVGSESSEVLRELLNAGITKGAKVYRCGGRDRDKILEYSIYSPKIFAMIGENDAILGDRCIPVPMKRKTEHDKVERCRSKIVEQRGAQLTLELEAWSNEYRELADYLYKIWDPFDIANDRMAELLLPLQCALLIDDYDLLPQLETFAHDLDERDRRQESQSPGVRLLAACRELFVGADSKTQFIPTSDLLDKLKARTEEPWNRWNKGEGLSAEALANLLRPYGIKPQPNKGRKQRGYFACDFVEAWDRYLPSEEKPSNPSNPAKGRRP